ncbi:molybdate ABC transporter substrate-binding protein [Marinifilum flexuosum]|uniref:Molybdate transport system substrate-binding protein n=1 Tax=Marinifilum flexuosum TaxID=1117708 RepID=A0A419XAT5_9BACT|nr:molybdate ABC transporter substrate-binding protein [Marinifilum flexuosum]RKE04867.1 molybdate transport system substrate-binding protein [Marinifilum flexuosum]
MNKTVIVIILSMFVLSCSSRKNKNSVVTLFAASSVTNVAQEIAESFERETGIKVKLNIASSGILARQIESGADFDYYISANKKWMDYIDSLNMVEESTIKNLATNRLVAIVPLGKDKKPNTDEIENNFSNLFTGRLSIGDPKHVPAGKYAMQAIKFYGWKEDLVDRYLPAKNVRDALLMVEMGEAEMGIVYETDAMKSEKVNIVYRFPLIVCESIAYVGAAKKERSESLNSFLLYLQSEEVKSIWRTNGFNLEEYE